MRRDGRQELSAPGPTLSRLCCILHNILLYQEEMVLNLKLYCILHNILLYQEEMVQNPKLCYILHSAQCLYEEEMVQNLKLCCILHNIYIRRWFKTSSFAVSYTISILGDGSKPQALLYPTQYTSLKGELVQNLKLYYIFRS